MTKTKTIPPAASQSSDQPPSADDKKQTSGKSYVCMEPIKHNGKNYLIGDPIELNKTEAAPLLGLQAIEAA